MPFKIRAATWLALVAAVGGLGYVDWVTGFEVSWFVFYFIPVGLAAWRLGLAAGVSLALFSAAAWGLADYFSGHAYSSQMIAGWNVFVRLVAFLTVAWLTARNSALLARERAISAELRETLGEVKALEGLLPVCISCKKIRNEQGEWLQMERYVQSHSAATFSHGYCPECAKQWLQQSGLDKVSS